MSYVPRSLPAQGDTTANALSVEAMFAQILGAVEKSVGQFRWVKDRCFHGLSIAK